MANIKSSKKRILVNDKRALRNKIVRSMVKTSIRRVSEKTGEEREIALRRALGFLDRAVSKGVYKRNTADRKKSALVKKCRAV